jgi:hypothetical protein
MRKKQHDDDRREFLKQMALGGGAVAVAAVSGGTLAAPESEPRKAAEPAQPKGYHETDHIREYYRTAGL